jgi:uncharacterized damage-inducible protein DinB
MAEAIKTLDIFYESWQLYQEHLKAALAPLTAEQLALRAAPHLRSIREIAAHVIAGRVHWFSEFLGEGDDDTATLRTWDEPGAPELTAQDLLRGLDRSWQLMAARLQRWTSADMAHTFPHEWRGNQYGLSRSWVVWHLLEHDLHHGGEISLMLGMHGLQAPDV